MSPTYSKSKIFTAVFFASMISASLSYAQPGDHGRPQGPPPESIEACADLSQGDTCSFTSRRDDEAKGTCIVLPRGDEGLACAPEGGPPQERGRPDKLTLSAPIAVSTQTAVAEIEMRDVFHAHNHETSEPRPQFILFPGIARAPTKSLMLHMQDASPSHKITANLNTNLLNENESHKFFSENKDIEISSNNILELRF